MTEAPIFIVGSPRSGTGLLRDLLRSHPRLSFPPESHFIPAFARAWGDPASDEEARALARRILALRRVRAWGVTLEPDAVDGVRSFAGVLDGIYGALAEREGKARWGDKTPRYVTEIPLLLRLFPRAKIVHMCRDGRDVALSWMRAPRGPDNAYVAAGGWRRYVAAGRSHGRAVGESYTEVRYEDLLGDPRATMTGLCEFLDEPFTEAVLRPDLGARHMWGFRRYPWLHASLAGRHEIVSGNRGRWRTEMGPDDRALFESVAGDMLRELGYETEGLARPISALERVRLTLDDRLRGAGHALASPRRTAGTFLDQREAALRTAFRRVRR